MRAYLTILRLPGALAFCAAGFLARAGGAMMGIGTVLMISALYDSYGDAGAVSAVNSVGWAIGSAILANLVDRHGQRRIMLPSAMISATALTAMILLAVAHADTWVLFIPSAISGLTGGAAGGMVRARWNHLLDDPHQLHAAFSLESALDEVTFIIGPVVATILATSLFPEAGLVVVVIVSIVGSLVFYSLRATEPPPHPREAGAPAASLLLALPGFVPVIGVAMAVGMAFGSIDVTTVAATEAWGAKWTAGIVLGIMSAGSAISGLLFGSRHWTGPLQTRLLIGVVVFAGGAATFLLAASPVVLAACGFVAGMAVSPTFITANSLIQRLVPESRLTEGLAWLGTSIGIGVSIGASVAGHFIDLFGYHAGFLTVDAVAVVAISGAVAAAQALKGVLAPPIVPDAG